jgi:hypothetical protein
MSNNGRKESISKPGSLRELSILKCATHRINSHDDKEKAWNLDDSGLFRVAVDGACTAAVF